MIKQYDLLVIGAGSGGIAAANRAAEYGAKVAVFESNAVGGTCVNVGCVPKKVMWYAADMAHHLSNAAAYGFDLQLKEHNWKRLVGNRQAYIDRLHRAYHNRFELNHIEYIQAQASLGKDRQHKEVVVTANNVQYQARHILIASGGVPAVPKIPGAELGMVSDDFFKLQSCPKSIAIVGAGYIAVELAGMLRALGAQVTLILRGHALLRHFDEMLQIELEKSLLKQGITIIKDTQIGQLAAAEGGVELTTEDGRSLVFEKLLWAIGRNPNTEALNLQACGVELDERGYIKTDRYQNTNINNVYAVGDVTGRAPLTPVAIAAGRRLSDRIFNHEQERFLDYDTIATVVFSHPPIGTVGMTEQHARERYADDIKIYHSRFTPMSHAFTPHQVDTHMKLITHGCDEKVIACHVIGAEADEMLQGFAVAVRAGVSKKIFDDTVAIHPTSAEEFVTMR